MAESAVSASRFKAECLRLMDDVAQTGEPLTVTKRGKPLVRVLPVNAPTPLRGSVTFLVGDDELAAPIRDAWDAAAE